MSPPCLGASNWESQRWLCGAAENNHLAGRCQFRLLGLSSLSLDSVFALPVYLRCLLITQLQGPRPCSTGSRWHQWEPREPRRKTLSAELVNAGNELIKPFFGPLCFRQQQEVFYGLFQLTSHKRAAMWPCLSRGWPRRTPRSLPADPSHWRSVLGQSPLPLLQTLGLYPPARQAIDPDPVPGGLHGHHGFEGLQDLQPAM